VAAIESASLMAWSCVHHRCLPRLDRFGTGADLVATPEVGSRTISTIPHLLIKPDVQHGHLPQSAAIRPADGVRPSVAAAARGFVLLGDAKQHASLQGTGAGVRALKFLPPASDEELPARPWGRRRCCWSTNRRGCADSAIHRATRPTAGVRSAFCNGSTIDPGNRRPGSGPGPKSKAGGLCSDTGNLLVSAGTLLLDRMHGGERTWGGVMTGRQTALVCGDLASAFSPTGLPGPSRRHQAPGRAVPNSRGC
jgi:hypothetical protein